MMHHDKISNQAKVHPLGTRCIHQRPLMLTRQFDNQAINELNFIDEVNPDFHHEKDSIARDRVKFLQ